MPPEVGQDHRGENDATTPAPPIYAYRLIVAYPEGVDEMHPPAAWVGGQVDVDEWERFRWPRVHPYLSYSGARVRAKLLRSYGCTVSIERSNPVTWPGDE